MKDNFVVTIAGGGSTYTLDCDDVTGKYVALSLREIRLYDNHHQRQKTIGDACAIPWLNASHRLSSAIPPIRRRPLPTSIS